MKKLPYKFQTFNLIILRSPTSMTTNINDTLNQRQSTYGFFEDNTGVTNSLYETLYPWIEDEQPYIKEALHMILHKISRIACGDSSYKDSWVDIIGYSQCVLDILKRKETLNDQQ